MQELANDPDTVSPVLLQIPHEDDTEDIAIEINEDLGYNKAHSKLWN